LAQQFSASVSLTTDLTTVAFGFRPTYIRVEPSTANTAFLNFSTIIATTASSLGFALTSGAVPLVIANPIVNGMSSAGFTAVSSSGGTTIIRVFAVRI